MTDNTLPRYPQATIEADERVPGIHIRRDFSATIAQLVKAHTDPELYVQWVGPADHTTTIDHWDCRTLGSWRYVTEANGEEFGFRGTFPYVGDDKLIQTFTFEMMPDVVALETMTFEDLGDGYTRLHAFSLTDSFEGRDAMLASGMEVGINDGYAKLDGLLSDAAVADSH